MSIVLMHQFEAEAARARAWAKAWKRAAKRKDKAMRFGASQHSECVIRLAMLEAKIEALPALIQARFTDNHAVGYQQAVIRMLQEHFGEGK